MRFGSSVWQSTRVKIGVSQVQLLPEPLVAA